MFAVGQQMQGDGGRPLAVLVVGVIPDLGGGYGSCFRCTAVGNGVTICRVSCNSTGVTHCITVGVSIGDERSIFADCYGCGGTIFINAICGFFYSVADYCTALAINDFILGQAFESIGPVVGGAQRHSAVFNIVGIQGDRDAVRPDTILVFCVSPNLGNRDVDGFGGVGVGDGVSIGGSCGTADGITIRNILLHDGVHIIHADTVMDVQICESSLPVVVGLQCCGFISRITISVQGDDDAARTLTILIVDILPFLFDRDGSCFGGMAIGNGDNTCSNVQGIRRGITADRTFHCAVVDNFLVFILGKIFDGDVKPGTIGVGSHGYADLSAATVCYLCPTVIFSIGNNGGIARLGGCLPQVEGQAGGAQIVLIVGVVPRLTDIEGGFLRCVRVDDRCLGGHCAGIIALVICVVIVVNRILFRNSIS